MGAYFKAFTHEHSDGEERDRGGRDYTCVSLEIKAQNRKGTINEDEAKGKGKRQIKSRKGRRGNHRGSRNMEKERIMKIYDPLECPVIHD